MFALFAVVVAASRGVSILRLGQDPLYQVQRYRGVANGWQPMGAPLNHKQAVSRLNKAQSCLPTATLRLVPLVA